MEVESHTKLLLTHTGHIGENVVMACIRKERYYSHKQLLIIENSSVMNTYLGETNLEALFPPHQEQSPFHINKICYQLWPIHECWLRVNYAYDLAYVHVSWGTEKQNKKRVNKPH